MDHVFFEVWALCGTIPLRSGLLAGMAMAGLAGSPMHCGPMCGGFVLGQAADRMARLPAQGLCEWQRIRSAALLPYHLGRLTTYSALGAVAGGVGAALGRLPWLGWLSAALLLGAALLFLSQALRRLAPALAAFVPGLDRAPPGWSAWIARLTRPVNPARVPGGFVLGVALGFLPCGFLYGALTAAAASGSAMWGAAAMLAFGLGTVPALVGVGLAGRAAAGHWQAAVRRFAPAVMLVNAGVLVVLAVRIFAATV